MPNTMLQEKLQLFSKMLAVLSVFLIPLSTSLLHVSLLSLVVCLIFSGDLKTTLNCAWQNPIAKWILLLFFLFLMGAFYSESSSKDVLENLSKMSKILYFVVFLPLMRDGKWRTWAWIAFLSSMVISLMMGMLKFYFDLPLHLKYSSSVTVFKSYIDTNLMMALATFILAQFLFLSQAKWVKMGLGILLILMTTYILGFSEGRSGYVVFVLLWALFFVQKMNVRKVIIGICGLFMILAAAGIFSPKFQERLSLVPQEIQKYQRGESFTSIGQRLDYLQHTLKLAKTHIWFGWGTGSLKQVYAQYAFEKGLQITGNPHNEYLNILFQLGVVGLFVFVSILVALYQTSLKLPIFERHILQGIALSMAVGCFANSWLMDFTPGYLFIILTAICSSALLEKEAVYGKE